MEYITQIIIAVVTTSLGSILTYFQATKKFKTDLETVKINSETEIKKIREEADKKVKEIKTQFKNEIKKIKTETEQQIKLMIAESDIASKQNEEALKNEATNEFLKSAMKNPQKAMEQLKGLQSIADMFKK